MSEEEIRKMSALDDAADRAGGYVAAMFDSHVQFDYQKLLIYCREQQKEPQDLTLRELRQFILKIFE